VTPEPSRLSIPMPHRWAPRVPAGKIARLYEADALGLPDEELLDDVGSALVARGYSFLVGNKAMMGTITCLDCGRELPRDGGDKERVFACDCGWRMSWGGYQQRYQHQQLTGVSVATFVEDYIRAWLAAHTIPEKMRAIDALIHSFHWELERTPTRPLAVNFIDLRLNECIRFILGLAYGAGSVASREAYDRWLDNARRAGYYAAILGERAGGPSTNNGTDAADGEGRGRLR
jgi:hypothetical protein